MKASFWGLFKANFSINIITYYYSVSVCYLNKAPQSKFNCVTFFVK